MRIKDKYTISEAAKYLADKSKEAVSDADVWGLVINLRLPAHFSAANVRVKSYYLFSSLILWCILIPPKGD